MNLSRLRFPRSALLAVGLSFGLVGVSGDQSSMLGRAALRARAASILGGPAAAGSWSAPAPLETGDADHDGLADDFEQAVAARYAPAVILDGSDWNRPASIPWLLARVDLLARPPEAQLASAIPFASGAGSRVRRESFNRDVRSGSADPRDWATYVHVFPAPGGGTDVQYWFFYGYNDGPLFFDHEGDWEHVTVELDAAGAPTGVYFAQHENNDPGVFRSWSDVRKQGDHPIVLSARGTHASYPDQASLAWFEKASACLSIDGCRDPVWYTWQGGGLVNMGERGAVLASPEVLAYDGRWGQAGNLIPGTSAPAGPMQQRGFCSGGFDRCSRPHALAK